MQEQPRLPERNSVSIQFILNNFHIMSQGLNKEIANRTKEQSLLKSPLARQVREELLNYASIIKGSLIDRIKELFSVTSLEMKLVLERLEGVKEAVSIDLLRTRNT